MNCSELSTIEVDTDDPDKAGGRLAPDHVDSRLIPVIPISKALVLLPVCELRE